jgi:hypothetical protein
VFLFSVLSSVLIVINSLIGAKIAFFLRISYKKVRLAKNFYLGEPPHKRTSGAPRASSGYSRFAVAHTCAAVGGLVRRARAPEVRFARRRYYPSRGLRPLGANKE